MMGWSLPAERGAPAKAFYSRNPAKVLFDLEVYFDRVHIYLNREIGIRWQQKIKVI